jgi:hypothetical protein
MTREHQLEMVLRDLLEQIDDAVIEFSDAHEPGKAEVCWDFAVARARHLIYPRTDTSDWTEQDYRANEADFLRKEA